MPAGPAPTTATRRGRCSVGDGATPSSDTTGILTRPRPGAPGTPPLVRPDDARAIRSDAGVVAVEAALQVLGQRDPAARGEGRLGAVLLGRRQRAGAGQPAVLPGQVARGGHGADDP